MPKGQRGFSSESAKEIGKRTKRGLSKEKKLIKDLITEEDKVAVYKTMKEMALIDKNPKMVELFAAYSFGKPEQSIDIKSDGEKITASLFMLPDGTEIGI